MKDKLRKIFLLGLLAWGSILGIPMDPREIEELLAGMNQAKECTLEEHDGSGDPDSTDGRKTCQNPATHGTPRQADDADQRICT